MHQGCGANIASDADFLSPPTFPPLEQAFHRTIVLYEPSGVEEMQRDNDQSHLWPNKQRLLFLRRHRNLTKWKWKKENVSVNKHPASKVPVL
jgi:hypothetical protein